jgi:hypothetical protein
MVWSYCHMAILPENPATRLGGGEGEGPLRGSRGDVGDARSRGLADAGDRAGGLRDHGH